MLAPKMQIILKVAKWLSTQASLRGRGSRGSNASAVVRLCWCVRLSRGVGAVVTSVKAPFGYVAVGARFVRGRDGAMEIVMIIVWQIELVTFRRR